MGIPLIHSGVKYFVLLLLWAAACLAFKWSAVLQNAVGLGLLVLGIVEHVLTLHAVGNAEQIGAQVKEKPISSGTAAGKPLCCRRKQKPSRSKKAVHALQTRWLIATRSPVKKRLLWKRSCPPRCTGSPARSISVMKRTQKSRQARFCA